MQEISIGPTSCLRGEQRDFHRDLTKNTQHSLLRYGKYKAQSSRFRGTDKQNLRYADTGVLTGRGWDLDGTLMGPATL